MTFARALTILVLFWSFPALADAPGPTPLPAPAAPQPVPRPAGIPDMPAPEPIADAPKGGPADLPTVQGYGASDAECQEWTDACHICARDEKGATQCSTPGTACTPDKIICRTRKPLAPAEPPKEKP